MQDIRVHNHRLLLWGAVLIAAVSGLVPLTLRSQQQKVDSTVSYKKLTPDEERVILHKGTEAPFTGKYYRNHAAGTYVCKQCGAPLFHSSNKFDSECGWPSFDDAIPGAVKRTLDADGIRTEITCVRCGGHLGHVFEGEHLTSKDTRYCVNSISMDFIPDSAQVTTEKAYFAGGCFWGTEYWLKKAAGVISARVGYMGGHTKAPTYEEVCGHGTGHAETVEVVFDPTKTNYETLARIFFEIHDPTQVDRQGPDVGDQYRSAIFYTDENQRLIAEKLIGILKAKGYKVVTQVVKADTFWEAEKYHQDYYARTGKEPYCHFYTKRF